VPEFVSQDEAWKALDQWLRGLRRTQSNGGTDLLLIDGPAGVGKTAIVREAALLRENLRWFPAASRPSCSSYQRSEQALVQRTATSRHLKSRLEKCAVTSVDQTRTAL
jgi:DNA polymerase III delta prime subunit